MGNDVLFYIVEGEGEITVDDKREILFPWVSIIVPKEAKSLGAMGSNFYILHASPTSFSSD